MLSVKSSKILLSVAVITTVIFVIISIYIFTREKEFSEKVQATISSADCEDEKKTGIYDCELRIYYVPKNKPQIKTEELNNVVLIPKSSKKYNKDDKIYIYHNKKYPSLISQTGQTNTWGYILLPLGFLIVVVSFFMLLKAKRYEAFYNQMN